MHGLRSRSFITLPNRPQLILSFQKNLHIAKVTPNPIAVEVRIFQLQIVQKFTTGLIKVLRSRQPREKLQRLYENQMSNNFRKTAVLKKI